MRVLLVTGQLAKDIVKRYARESKKEFGILDLPMPVAALLTPRYIAHELVKHNPKGFDVTLVPGMMKGDTSPVEKATGIETFKGPRYAADLPLVLDLLERIELSKQTPACDLLKEELRRKALEEIEEVERDRDELLRNPENMLIGDLAIGKDFPMRVVAEIVDAPLRHSDEVQMMARYYVESGAHIIDVGMTAGESQPQHAERCVRAVKDAVRVPVSIDTLNSDEAEAGVSAGADIILSLDGGNVEELSRFASRVAVVVIPTNHREGYYPKEASKRVETLEENIARARRLGIKNLLADPILDSVNVPGVVESIAAYREFGSKNPKIPLFCGVGNVTELMHADTVGVNALAAGIASELDVSLLLTTEVAGHALGSVRELAVASKMMFLAKRRASIPKGLGIDLLVYKERKSKEDPYNRGIEENKRVVETAGPVEHVTDPKGYFKIMVDRDKGKIVAAHFPRPKVSKPEIIIKGYDATNIYRKIVEMRLVSRLDHAAYLGCELGKAEVALRTGRSYVQDSPLFS
ncbi:MAG: dihydropteroate synthase-like protein [Nitrososphaeria archaeon]|nr:dihydropteroate synthase-like protein [Nitrososphaeria archaeon]NIN51605.1 dihydropteroate synthase-like protein [Nitrososphaeria archaeon]NIQ32090.1 dihydropteroate synthase-like protein [Nitrososphaeria archaeon]